MKIALIVIGKTDAGYFVEAINEYKNRLVHYIPFRIPTKREGRRFDSESITAG